MKIQEKVKELPLTPGVYLFKDKTGKIIYVGKAARLRNRVSSYFRSPLEHDPKTYSLVQHIADVSYIETLGEFEALFLESELIKRYRPKYNVIWQDEKNWLYIKVDSEHDYPTVEYVRRPMSDKSTYLGPFIDAKAIKLSLRSLRRVFPYHTHPQMPKRACLDYHLGLCAGPEIGAVGKTEYRQMIRRLVSVIEGKEQKVLAEMKRDMKSAARAKEFERAAYLRDHIGYLVQARRRVLFGQEESLALSADTGLVELAKIVGLEHPPRRIEAYDISHIQGSATAASMIVFYDGLPKRDEYRRFKIKTVRGVDDFESMREVMRRRFTPRTKAEKSWPAPDLLLIDGGKGQLSAVDSVLTELAVTVPRIGLAKREETIILLTDGRFAEVKLPHRVEAVKLVQRVRDEAHRFALLYHHILSAKQSVGSKLDAIAGVGPVTKRKLIKKYGSVRGVAAATLEELTTEIGPKLAALVKESL